MQVKISDIKGDGAVKEDLSDLELLKVSIKKDGISHPIAIDRQNNLIFGYKRVNAYKQLGLETIEAESFDNIEEALKEEEFFYRDMDYGKDVD